MKKPSQETIGALRAQEQGGGGRGSGAPAGGVPGYGVAVEYLDGSELGEGRQLLALTYKVAHGGSVLEVTGRDGSRVLVPLSGVRAVHIMPGMFTSETGGENG